MFESDNLLDMFLDNIKTLFFPEEWIKLDMNFSKLEILTLLYLEKKHDVTMTELVDYLNSPMSTATGIIDRLVKNEMVIRSRSEQDRRSVLLNLSKNGAELVASFRTTVNSYVHLIIEDLTEEEKRFIIQIVLKIVGRLQKHLSGDGSVAVKNEEIKQIPIE